MENQTIGTISAISLAVLAIILGMGGNPDAGNIHYGTDGLEVTCQPRICESLSKINSNGLQTRCYYFVEEENRTRYKNCQDGWIKFEYIKAPNTINANGTLCYVYKQNDLVKQCKTEDGKHVIYILGD